MRRSVADGAVQGLCGSCACPPWSECYASGPHVRADPICPALQTWLLQPCLGGDAKMLMVANVAPTAAAAAESLCSLRFAAKVNATHIGTARRAVSYAK